MPPVDSSPPIDLEDFVDSRKVGRFHVLILTLAGSVMFLDGLDTQAISFIAPVAAREWGLPVSALGPIFSASILGLMIGYLLLSPLATRVGHRSLVLLSSAVFGLFTVVSAFAADESHLILLRLVTGIGLGGAIPSAVALASEFAPKRCRSTCVMGIYCCYAFGFVVASLVSGPVIRVVGWQGMFVICGSLPLVLLVALALLLPDSPSRLLRDAKTAARGRQVLRRLSPGSDVDRVAVPGFLGASNPQSPRSVLLDPVRRSWLPRTLLLWLAFMINLGVFYAVQSWLPTIARENGATAGTAATATALMMVGGILAAGLIGPAMDRRGPFAVLTIVYLAAAVLLTGMGLSFSGPAAALLVAAFLAGTCVVGGQMSVIALATVLYPTTIRSTGVGWALGMGRVGGILAPLMVGYALGGSRMEVVFVTMGSVMLLASIAVALLARSHRGSDHSGTSRATRGTSEIGPVQAA
ncbi:MFS transporter [Pseudonocardia halophobica]|uniref:MFS transporter n=1 Tax=Pseudonocardia halophobica TaxID=29401 RepID=UPI003D9150BC